MVILYTPCLSDQSRLQNKKISVVSNPVFCQNSNMKHTLYNVQKVNKSTIAAATTRSGKVSFISSFNAKVNSDNDHKSKNYSILSCQHRK